MRMTLGVVLSAVGSIFCVGAGWAFAMPSDAAPSDAEPATVLSPVVVAVAEAPTLVAAEEALPAVIEPVVEPVPTELVQQDEPTAEAEDDALRIPFLRSRVALDQQAQSALSPLLAYVPTSNTPPTHIVEVTMGVERVDLPRELAERRFLETVRVLRQRGFWRSQIRDRGWRGSDTGFVELRVVPLS